MATDFCCNIDIWLTILTTLLCIFIVFIILHKRRSISHLENKIMEMKKEELLLIDLMVSSQKTMSMKTDFISKMNHDLKNPLNSITGIVYLALNKLDKPNEIEKYLKKILKSAHDIKKISNNAIDISDIQSGKFTLSRNSFTINDFIKSIESIVAFQAKEKKVKFIIISEVKRDLPLIGDLNKLNHIMLNILCNAIKFTSRYGKVILTISKVVKINNNKIIIRFKITDTGIWKTEEFIHKIHELFNRGLRHNSIDNDGNNIDLSIMKSFVDLMDGNIFVKGDFGEATEFVVEIPFIYEGQEREDEFFEEKPSYDFSSKRILIADDDELNLEIGSEILKMTGVKVDCVTSGAEAVSKFSNSPLGYYDAMFLDLRMPDLDGYETTRIIRKLERDDAWKITIIALSACSSAEEISKAHRDEMDYFITKPIDINRLYAIINII